jgi:hypothetical protein
MERKVEELVAPLNPSIYLSPLNVQDDAQIDLRTFAGSFMGTSRFYSLSRVANKEDHILILVNFQSFASYGQQSTLALDPGQRKQAKPSTTLRKHQQLPTSSVASDLQL